MPAKKRKAKTGTTASKKPKKAVKKKAAPKARPKHPAAAGHTPSHAVAMAREEAELRLEIHKKAEDLFTPDRQHWTFKSWVKRYSPVLICMLVAMATYFYLIFYLFYPKVLIEGHLYVQILILVVFIFLIVGMFVFLGFRSELMFIRILSFVFVFVIFTFLLIFILLANLHLIG